MNCVEYSCVFNLEPDLCPKGVGKLQRPPLHIKLLPLFRTDSIAQVVRGFEGVASGTTALRIVGGNQAYYSAARNHLVREICPNPTIMQLHGRLIEELGQAGL